ncbi:MAG: TIM barrel protein [Ktedonobacterales bacterium]
MMDCGTAGTIGGRSEHGAPKLLCSSGAFSRESDQRDHHPIVEYGPQLAADGVIGIEVIFYSHWSERQGQITANLRASSLRFPVVHAEKSIGLLLVSGQPADTVLAIERLRRNCQFARDLDADLVVLHLWGSPGSDEHIERNLASLPACLDVAQNYGLTQAVETIPGTVSDPLALSEIAIARDARCTIALDSEFLAFHDQLEEVFDAKWLWERDQDNQGNRVRHIHVKDYDGALVSPEGRRRYLHPGEGSIDFTRLFARVTRTQLHGQCEPRSVSSGPRRHRPSGAAA